MTSKQMYLKGVPLVAMSEKTVNVLLGKYLTQKPGTSPKPSETEPKKKSNNPSSSPQPDTSITDSFTREEVPHYAKPLKKKVQPLETPSFKQPILTTKQNIKRPATQLQEPRTFEMPFEAQRLIDMSLSQSRIVNNDDDSSFEVNLDDIVRQTDQNVLAKVIGQSLERNTGGNKNSKLVGFSNNSLPKKISAKISDNIGQNPYFTPNKKGEYNISKTFELTSNDSNEMQDQVGSLVNSKIISTDNAAAAIEPEPNYIAKNDKKVYGSLDEALRRPSVFSQSSSVIQVLRSPTMKERLLFLQGNRRRESLKAPDLIPDKKDFEEYDAEAVQHLNQAMLRVQEVYSTIVDLDWQLTKGKHIVEKYKDLVVKMQLQLNSKEYKIEQVKQEKQRTKQGYQELRDHYQKLQQTLQTQKLHTPTKREQSNPKNQLTPARLDTLLQEINTFVQGQENTNKIDVKKAKHVMQNMSGNQLKLVEQMQSRLKQEQSMRLQTEEQHHLIMEQFFSNQINLENQIRVLKDKQTISGSADAFVSEDVAGKQQF